MMQDHWYLWLHSAVLFPLAPGPLLRIGSHPRVLIPSATKKAIPSNGADQPSPEGLYLIGYVVGVCALQQVKSAAHSPRFSDCRSSGGRICLAVQHY